MKSKTSKKPPTQSKPISSWDDAVFDPADLVRDMQGSCRTITQGKKKIDLTHISLVVAPAPKFSPTEIVELREARKFEPALVCSNFSTFQR